MSVDGRRKLRAYDLIFFVIAAAAPLGFTVGTIPLALGRGGTDYALAIIITAVVLAIFAVGYVTMAGHASERGGLYEFVREGIGMPAGTGAAFVAALTYTVAGTGAIGVFAVLTQTFAAGILHFSAPWWVWAAFGAAAMGIMGVLNTEFNARILGVIIVIEIAILATVVGAVLIRGGDAGLTLVAFEPSGLFSGSAGTMFALAIVAFAGFEATVIYSSETENRYKTVLYAAVGSLALMAVLYAAVSWAIVTGLGAEKTSALANSDPLGLFFAVTETYVGSWLVHVAEFMVVTSWFASIVAFHNATARYLASMGADGMLPRWLGVRSARTGAPVRTSLLHTGVTFGVILLTLALNGDPYLDLFVLGSTPALIGIPALEILASIAIVAYFFKNRRGHSIWTVLVAPLVAAALLGAFLWQIIAQLDLFTGRGELVNTLLWGMMAAVFILGCLRGLAMKRVSSATDAASAEV